MKSKIINTLILAAISSSSLVSCADSSNHNRGESSQINNISSDIATTAIIKKAILNDKEMDFFNIHVTTINGKVTLAGIVPNKDIKNKLVSLVRNTKDVLEINDQLETSESGIIDGLISDFLITNEIEYRYLTDDVISSLIIYVKTENGEVTLVGSAPSEIVKSKIIAIAENVKSVKKVNPIIAVDQSINLKTLISDSMITNSIKLDFLKDNSINIYDIHVETINGKVTLKGIVKSQSMKNKIINIVKSRKDVSGVISLLTVHKN